ncbi:hypothetical protein XAC3612_1200014 [Xanthomonas citri pv. citri]|nr:hypothetical protein XAC3612_1200014 [Xanthomonas citri pv. citri]
MPCSVPSIVSRSSGDVVLIRIEHNDDRPGWQQNTLNRLHDRNPRCSECRNLAPAQVALRRSALRDVEPRWGEATLGRQRAPNGDTGRSRAAAGDALPAHNGKRHRWRLIQSAVGEWTCACRNLNPHVEKNTRHSAASPSEISTTYSCSLYLKFPPDL